jgi:hypothetical protein
VSGGDIDVAGHKQAGVKAPARWMEGTITIVQEGRFQLSDDRGVSHQFVLDRVALVETEQLRPLQSRQARVRVKYTDASGLISLIAHRIELLEPKPSEPEPLEPVGS